MISKTAARTLREIYLDEMIIIHLKGLNVVAVNEEQETVSISPMIEGLVIDVDQDFIYLGLPDGSIFKVVPHESVGLIEMMGDPMNMIGLDAPDVGEEVH